MASGLNHSKGYGAPTIIEAPSNNRACDLPSGKIKEVIRTFDPQNYELEYEVIEGFPFFVDTAINNWQLNEIGSDTTRVNIASDSDYQRPCRRYYGSHDEDTID